MSRRGFTLLELLIVVAVIALLVGLLIPALAGAHAQARRVKCQSNLRSIGHAVQLYLPDNRDTFPDVSFYGALGYIGRFTHHAEFGSQCPESGRPLNRHFGVTDSSLPPGPPLQVEMKRNDAFACPADRGDAYNKLPGTYFVAHGASYVFIGAKPSDSSFLYGIQSCRKVRLVNIRYPAKKIVFMEPVFNQSFDMSRPQAQWHHRSRNHGNTLFADAHVGFLFAQIPNSSAPPSEDNPYY